VTGVSPLPDPGSGTAYRTDLQTPSGEESVKSVHGRREGYGGKDWGKGEFWDKNGSVKGGNVDYGRYPAVSLRTYPSAGRRRQDWTSISFASYLRQQILAYADTVHGKL